MMQYTIYFLLLTLPAIIHPVPDIRKNEKGDITGSWVRISPTGPISLNFKTDGTVEGDFGNDSTIEIVSEYKTEGDKILFHDQAGVTCPEPGEYRIYINEYYISFDLVRDNCAGRLRSTMGFWVRPDFRDRLSGLSDRIIARKDPEDYLNRGRMYLALGKPDLARQDLDVYIQHHPAEARVFVNRAGSRMVDDLKGAVDDCNQALKLEPDNRNAYFLRGQAHYGLGRKEEACADFYRAIELGFEVLREAEYEKCADFWKNLH